MPLRKWVESANYAIEGILYAVKTQRHLRYHFFAAALILLLSFILGISQSKFIVITIVVIIVLSVTTQVDRLKVPLVSFWKQGRGKAETIRKFALINVGVYCNTPHSLQSCLPAGRLQPKYLSSYVLSNV